MSLTLYMLNTAQPVTVPFKYPFISMNNKPHLHRCVLMDQLAKYNLIDRGAISWQESGYASEQLAPGDLPSRSRGHVFQYWKPVKKILDQAYADNTNLIHELPVEYRSSFMQVVAESTERTFVITEKASTPLFMKKPFLVLASPGYHHSMALTYGFVKYDELFDYSFDSVPDLTTRAAGLVDNVRRVSELSPDEQEYWYNRLLPKLEFNAALARSICVNKNNIPPLMSETRNSQYAEAELIQFIEAQHGI